jgi:hypothetical protein
MSVAVPATRQVRQRKRERCVSSLVPYAQACVHLGQDLSGRHFLYLSAREPSRPAHQPMTTLGLFGRTLSKPEARAAMVVAATGEMVEVGNQWLEPALWKMRDGSVYAGERWGDTASGLSDALCRQQVEAGAIQGDGRARGVRRGAENPVNIHLFTDSVIEGLAFDEFHEKAFFDAAASGLHFVDELFDGLKLYPLMGSVAKFKAALTEIGEQTIRNAPKSVSNKYRKRFERRRVAKVRRSRHELAGG